MVAGAQLFFDGLLAAAQRLGTSPFVLTVLVSGFELENLVAGVAANAKGLPGAAAGTFLGGTTFLALCVAGLGALIAPIRPGLPRRVYLWTAAAPLPLLGLSLDGDVSRLDGGVLVAWSAIALVAIARAGGVEMPLTLGRKRFALARLAAGLGVLAFGGELLGDGIRRVVQGFGVSATLLGNTAIAGSIEVEEVARVAVSGRRRRGDVALGNVLGTIVHFIAFNAGVIALVRPLELDADTLHVHLPAAAAAPALLAVVASGRRRIGRLEGTGLVAAYAAYLVAAVWVA